MIKIETKVGNLLHVQSGHIVHGCNAKGVMGSGVALAVKETYPHVHLDYVTEYHKNGLTLGRAYPVLAKPGLHIWNAITQDTYGSIKRCVSYDAIQTCFQDINYVIPFIESTVEPIVHIPMIGAARGGGNWEIIREIIEQTMDFPVILWMPDSTVTTL